MSLVYKILEKVFVLKLKINGELLKAFILCYHICIFKKITLADLWKIEWRGDKGGRGRLIKRQGIRSYVRDGNKSMHCMFITQSQASFHPHLPPICALLPPPTPFPLSVTILLAVSMCHSYVYMYRIFFFLIPSPFPLPSSPMPLPSDGCLSALLKASKNVLNS